MNYTRATYGYAHKHGKINNALLVDLKDPLGANNRAYSVFSTATNAPPNLAWGIREVMYISKDAVMVRITGIEKDGNTEVIWTCIYNYGTWRGWQKH